MRVMRDGLAANYTATHHMGVSPYGLLTLQAAKSCREDRGRCDPRMRRLAGWLVLLGCLGMLPTAASAFYQWRHEQTALETRGLLRGFLIHNQNPEDTYFYEDKTQTSLGGLGRVYGQASHGQWLSLDYNVYQTYIPSELMATQGNIGTPLDVERSGRLERSQSNDDYAHLAIDRLALRASYRRLDVTLGRQPINLTTTFYFTPNDFFAPFSAQVFYRVFKPGVDAARAELRLGNLSQLSYISVLGYQPDTDSDSGWAMNPDWDRTSRLGRVATTFVGFEWAVLGGQVRERDVAGGSLQGELFDWLGVRAEGHRAWPHDGLGPAYDEVAAGLEHRFENTLTLRLEQFYHGSGADHVADYGVTQNDSAYLGKRYTALGAGYEFTPLFSGELLAIHNWLDRSSLVSLNGLYSLSDEMELSASLGLPFGKKPDGPVIQSEYGLLPVSFSIEIRSYF